MREIIFRGKRLDNGEWVEGDLLQDRDLGKCMIEYFDYYYDEDGKQRDYCQYEVDPATVGQCAGVNDKNDKRIFEGDLVKHHDRIFGNIVSEIIYSKSGACFCARYIKCHNNKPALDIVMNESEIEIIGNIHDNPELLEG